jgi:hypothetical protein
MKLNWLSLCQRVHEQDCSLLLHCAMEMCALVEYLESQFLYEVRAPGLRANNMDVGTTLRALLPHDHLLLDSALNLGPLVSRWEINKFENC